MTKEVAFFKEVANAISQNTFDYEEAIGGYPDINWLIVEYMLEGYDKFTRHRMMDSMVGKVKQCLAISIDHAENVLGVKIYRGYTLGGVGKKLAFITPDPVYKDAKEQDYARIMRGVERKLLKAHDDVERRLPEFNEGRFIADSRTLIRRRRLSAQ